MQPLNFMFLALNRSLCSRSGDFLYVVSRMFEFFSCMNRLLMLYLQSRFFFTHKHFVFAHHRSQLYFIA